jgi:cytochrome b subunit of formate dehydrogenase
MTRTTAWVLLGAGVLLMLLGLAINLGLSASGAQPWGQLLSDNFVFARSVPFTLGLGVAVGAASSVFTNRAEVERRSDDGAIRRFSPGTVALHWVLTLGVLFGLVTGSWQYLKGLLAVDSPVPMEQVYRVHYIAASVLLFAVAAFLSDWWIRGEHALLVPGGTWARHLRGLAHELPRPMGSILAGFLGLDMRRPAPPVGQFTFYEQVISFPWAVIALGLITVTGVVKAMRYAFGLPPEILWWASVLHVAAMVLLGIKLLDHLRYVLAPERWPLMRAMVTTWISARYTQLRHPDWYRELAERTPVESDQAREPQPAPSPAGGRSL